MVRLLHRVALAAATAAGAVAYVLTNPPDEAWISSLRAVRFTRAACAAVGVSVDYKWSLRSLESGTPQYSKVMREIHLRSALRLREMCSLNGGLFIKVGQHVGALEYLFPREYVQTFKVFHSDAPQTPLARMKRVIEEELGKPADELFLELEATPLGAASLAQCHRGVLRDGRVVAVKIQHPDVGKNAYTDMETMEFLVHCASWLFPSFHFQWLADEVRRNLPDELNFIHEARNQEKFAAMFRHLKFVKAPKVHWNLTTPRVLTMEFCEGGKVDDLRYIQRNRIPVDEISLKLGQMYSEMIFQHGFIHCDPHPGNVLVRASRGGGAEIVMLDHGLYSHLTDELRLSYCQLWWALIRGDQGGIQRHCLALNAGELYPLLACMVTARAWEHVQTGISESRRSGAEIREMRGQIAMYLAEITQLLDTVPRQLLLIFKTNDLLRSLEHVLGSNVYQRSLVTTSRYCLRAIGDHQARNATSWTRKLLCRTRTGVSLAILRLYEVWLWWKAALSW